jgi:hypothetical protein
MRRGAFVVVLMIGAIAVFGGTARRRAINPRAPYSPPLDARRSFAVTDQAILDGFSFRRVMTALVDRSGTTTTADALVQQMYDTQNPKPGVVASAPHCDDFTIDGLPAFNGFPRRCPTPEATLASVSPFTADQYIPLAILNRFDQTPADGSNCGQYRLIFARLSPNPLDRLHLIFEAVLPNPNPHSGIAGCRPVAQFWADLTAINSISERRARLEQFFFTGIEGFDPVIDPDHFSLAGGGGIRTLQNTAASRVATRFYQFRLAKRCSSSRCDLIAEPDVLENMPFGRFFDATYDTPAARAFRDAFVRNIPTLAVGDLNLYSMSIPREFLMAESDPLDGELAFAYEVLFNRSRTTKEGQAFDARVQSELKRIGSTLRTSEVIDRAETQTCVGCHFLFGPIGDNLDFPRSLGAFQHVSETIVENGEAGPRFAISSAMQEVFIPHRMEIFRRYLAYGAAPVHSN